MSLKVSYDLDDTLVQFKGYYESKYGIPKNDLEITKNVVGPLMKDKEFWLNQPLLRKPEIIHCYCTARMISKSLIKKQLQINNLPKAPIYQVYGFAQSKFTQLKRSGAQVHIDDSIRVFKDLNSKGFPCLLIDTPYNQEWGPIARIYSLDIDEIEEVYDLFMKTMFPYFKELI